MDSSSPARPNDAIQTAQDKTIEDFGTQWTSYTDNEGYYGSQELFRDIIEPLLSADDFAGKKVAEIGAGTGRICVMALEAGVADMTAIEPSAAADVLERNLQPYGERVRALRVTGDEIPAEDFDLIISIGVLHHIPDPVPTVEAAYAALRPGGKMFVWLYGKEGNGAYLALVLPLRFLTRNLPHHANAALAWLLDFPLFLYMSACRVLPLPLYRYMRGYVAKLSSAKRRLVIYDQINPQWAKYYTRDEADSLMRAAGFVDLKLHHRGGYSWSVIGQRPVLDPGDQS